MTDDIANEKTVIKKDGARTAARIGRYTLGRRLGIGGMAEVFIAEQDGPQQFKKRVVVKRILPSLAADPQFVQMFVREAAVAARLSHANIVQILELGEHTEGAQTEYFIAMEHIDGLTLQRLAQAAWDDGKAVPVDVVLRTCADAARGLHAAHTLKDERGQPTPLVHRDVSPDNLMVSRDGVTKLLDFGIAKGDVGGPKTKTGNVRGKIPYMSPEQVTGQTLDARSDLYSLGVSMYFLLCGERPFDRGTDYHTMQALMHDAPKPLRAINAGVPEAVEALVLRLLAKDPSARPSSAADLADELEALTQPGTGAGRKTTISFVAQVIDKTNAAGNPLSEADGARATVPLENAAPTIDASAIVVAESVVPRQVTMPDEASAEPELPTAHAVVSVATVVEEAPEATAAPAAMPTLDAPPPAPAAPIAPAAAQPHPSAAAPARSDTAETLAGHHPVVDMLTPRREGLPPSVALVLVLVGMAAVAVPLAYFGVKLAQANDDAPASADAGTATTIADAGLVAPPVVDAGAVLVESGSDAGAAAVAATADAGAVAVPVVDAGSAAHVDAGSTLPALRADAGVVAPKPIRLVVRATAPPGVAWKLPSGVRVGVGTTTLSLPKGTTELVAHDAARQRNDTLFIALDGELRGTIDYTPLLTATLEVKNVGDAQVFLGNDDVGKQGRALAVPGSYNLRVFVGGERTIVKVSLKKGETTTIDVQKQLAKKK